MTYILRRKSVILSNMYIFAGFIGPALMGGHPSDVVGAPFARPVWWNSQLPLSSEYSVGNDGAVIEWKKLPPGNFRFEREDNCGSRQQGKDHMVYH